jgi:hypothetical protein
VYDVRTLKQRILVTDTQVECPVKGCSQKVARHRGVFQTATHFQCPEHHIYISASTFEYPTELDNILWKDEQDLSLLESIKGSKRESRMARDNSEDALSWNVFRYLEKKGHLSVILSNIIARDLGALKLVYWSYSAGFEGVWPELRDARKEFAEQPRHSSEPDLIAFSDKAVLFIEAKLKANNEPQPRDPENQRKYVKGGNSWYYQVFGSDYDTIVRVERKYQLLRFWLLGTWIAARIKRDFYLVNLVPSKSEQKIEEVFGKHIKANEHRRFVRVTWEEIYRHIAEKIPSSVERDLLLDYLEYKTVGYNRLGELQRAFSISKKSIQG